MPSRILSFWAASIRFTFEAIILLSINSVRFDFLIMDLVTEVIDLRQPNKRGETESNGFLGFSSDGKYEASFPS